MNIPTIKDKATGVVSVIIGGQTIATGTTDRGEAKRIAALAVQLGPIINTYGLGASPTVREVIAEWHEHMAVIRELNTAADNLTAIKAFASLAEVETTPINKVTSQHIDKWVNAKDGVKAGTRRVRLSNARTFFRFAAVRKYLIANPTDEVKVKASLMSHEQKEVKQKTVFSPQEFNAVINHLDAEAARLLPLAMALPPNSPKGVRLITAWNNAIFWRIATVLGRWTALRMMDIANLEWKSFTDTGIVKHTGKTGKRVDLQFGKDKDITNAEAVCDAISLIPLTDAKHCFPIQRTIDHSILSTYFKRICVAAGVQGHSFHDLRVTALTSLVKNGRTLEQAAKTAGHSSTTTTRGYVKD